MKILRMKKLQIPEWFLEKERKILTTGTLDLSGESITDLSFIRTKSSLRSLNLSFTSIISFEGLSNQPNLEYVILSGSSIQTLKNIEAIKNISKICYENTPLSRHPHSKLSMLISLPNLRIINGKLVSPGLIKKAKTYPPIASELINAGWLAEFPCPSSEEFSKLAIQYNLSERTERRKFHSHKHSQFVERDFDSIINAYLSIHQEMIEEAENRMNEEIPSDDDVNFEEPLSQVTSRFPNEKFGELDESGLIVSDNTSFSEKPSFDQESSEHVSEINEMITEFRDDDEKGSLRDRLIEVFSKYGYVIPEGNINDMILNKIDQLLITTEEDIHESFSSENANNDINSIGENKEDISTESHEEYSSDD